MGQPVAAVVAEAALAVGAPAEQAVQGRGARLAQLRADGVAGVEPLGGVVDGLLQARRGDGRGRRERDERLGPAGRLGLLGQQRDDARDGRRLAGARAAGDDGEAVADGGRAGHPLALVGVAGEEPREAVRQHVLVDVRRRLDAERLEVGGDLALLAPVAVEVQRGADQAQRPVRSTLFPDGDELARLQSLDPRADPRPCQRGEVDGLLGVDRRSLADGGEVDVDVAEARPAHGERRGQRDLLVGVARQRRQPAGDVDVGGMEHAGRVEVVQEAGRAGRAADVEEIGLREAHAPSPRSSTSLSATTSAPGGRHAKTPHGVPSTAGVSGPTIPRRKR